MTLKSSKKFQCELCPTRQQNLNDNFNLIKALNSFKELKRAIFSRSKTPKQIEEGVVIQNGETIEETAVE